MSTTEILRFARNDWLKGTRGKLHPSATDKPEIKNLRLWLDGSLGPRPLWKTVETDAIVNGGHTYRDDATFFAAQDGDATGATFLFVTGSNSRASEYNTVGGWSTLSALAGVTRSTGPSQQVSPLSATEALLPGGAILDWSANPPTWTAPSPTLFTTFGITSTLAVIHQGRAFYASGDIGTIAYSDAYDYTTFTSASQFFQVDAKTVCMVSLGSNLLIGCVTGEWFMLQGRGDPALGTLTSLGTFSLAEPGVGVATTHGGALYVSAEHTTLVRLNSGGAFDELELQHITPDRSPNETDYFGYLPAADSVLNRTVVPWTPVLGYVLENGMWSEETWPWPDTTQVGSFDDQIKIALHPWSNTEAALRMVSSSGTDAMNLHLRDAVAFAPNFSAAGDFSEYEETENGSLTLPRIFHPTKLVRVKRVIIDCRTWSPDGANGYPAASFTVGVDDGVGTSGNLTLGPGADPLGTVVSGEAPLRVVATASPRSYTSFSDVTISGIAGVAIEAVTVEFEVSEGPVI